MHCTEFLQCSMKASLGKTMIFIYIGMEIPIIYIYRYGNFSQAINITEFTDAIYISKHTCISEVPMYQNNV